MQPFYHNIVCVLLLSFLPYRWCVPNPQTWEDGFVEWGRQQSIKVFQSCYVERFKSKTFLFSELPAQIPQKDHKRGSPSGYIPPSLPREQIRSKNFLTGLKCSLTLHPHPKISAALSSSSSEYSSKKMSSSIPSSTNDAFSLTLTEKSG